MCATPCLKRQAVLGALAGDEAAHTAFARAAVGTPAAVAAMLAAVAKKAGTVNGVPAPVANTLKAPVAREAKASKECSLAAVVANTLKALVAREVKALKECSPAMADVAAPTEVVAAPAPGAKALGPYHPTGVVLEIFGSEMGDRGRSCEEHSN
jgi:hypothetical protein